MEPVQIFITFIFYGILYYLWKNRVNENKLEAELEEKLKHVVIVNIEKHGNCLYFWDKDTGEFLAQGKEIEEVSERCNKRYPNKTFLVTKEDVERYGFKVKL